MAVMCINYTYFISVLDCVYSNHMTDGISVESRIIKYSLIGLLKMSCITNSKHTETMSLLVILWPTKTKLNV